MIEDFYSRKYGTFVSVLRGRGYREEDAEDIVQSAFTNAFSRINTYNPEIAQIDTWFSTILLRAIIDFHHAEKKDSVLVDNGEEQDRLDTLESIDGGTFEGRILQEIQEDINSQRSVTLRNIFHLHFMLGYGANDVAAITGVDNHVVRQSIYRYRKQLREKYGWSRRRN